MDLGAAREPLARDGIGRDDDAGRDLRVGLRVLDRFQAEFGELRDDLLDGALRDLRDGDLLHLDGLVAVTRRDPDRGAGDGGQDEQHRGGDHGGPRPGALLAVGRR